MGKYRIHTLFIGLITHVYISCIMCVLTYIAESLQVLRHFGDHFSILSQFAVIGYADPGVLGYEERIRVRVWVGFRVRL